jgi:Restriction alleviation protein Lar
MSISPRSNSLADLLDALENHLVDYPTPANIHMQRKYLLDIRQHHVAVAQQPDACSDEGCPHYGKAIRCETKPDGCIATVAQQPGDWTELKPCPHCGVGKSTVTCEQDDYGYWIVCCGACGSSSGKLPDSIPNARERIIAGWNTRAMERESIADAELQNNICGIMTKYGVREIYDATNEVLELIENRRRG